jgi:hypothetical protein
MVKGIPRAYKSRSSKAEFGVDMFHCSRAKIVFFTGSGTRTR